MNGNDSLWWFTDIKMRRMSRMRMMIMMLRKRSRTFVAFGASIIILDDDDIGPGSPAQG